MKYKYFKINGKRVRHYWTAVIETGVDSGNPNYMNSVFTMQWVPK